MPSNLTTFDAILKEVYLGPIRDQLNSKTTVYGMLPKKDKLDGRRLVIPIRKSRNRSFGFQVAAGELKTAQNQGYSDAFVLPKYYYGTAEVTNEVIVQSRTSRGAFARAVKTEMEGLPLDMRDDLDRVILGDGSGTIGIIATSGISTTTLTDDTITLTEPAHARHFGEGLQCEFWDLNTPAATQSTHQAALTVPAVVAVDLDAGTVQFDQDLTGGASTTADGDHVTIVGARTTTVSYEMEGLQSIISNANPVMKTAGLQDLPVASNDYWKSYVDSNSGTNRAVSNKLLQNLIDAARIRGNGKPDLFVVPYGVRFEYADQQLNVRRNVNTTALSGQTSGGFREDEEARDFIEYNGHQFVPDKYAPQNTIMLVDTQSTYVARFADFDWMDLDGSILHRSTDRTPSYEAWMYMYGELVTEARNRNSKAVDVLGDDPA